MANVQDRRIKVGLLMADFPKDQPFFSGVVAAARAYDVNLFCILGRLLHWRGDFEYQGNVLYDLVDVEHLDGLITWAGAGVGLSHLSNQEEMAAFFAKFAPLPIVNYEKWIPGLHCVRTDTAGSMKIVLRHLLGFHQRRRVLLLRGPRHHYETEERVRAYRETLEEFNLPYQPELTLPPVDWMVDFEAVLRQSLDSSKLVPGRDFDAIAATESYLACAAIRILQSRGYCVPEDVAVVGFNEGLENLALHPPLTTINKSFFHSGYQALKVLLDVIAGKDVSSETLIQGELLLRSSCGCVSQAILEAGDLFQSEVPEDCSPAEFGDHLAQDLQRVAEPLTVRLPKGWVEQLWEAFQSDLQGEGRLVFVNKLTALMRHAEGAENSSSWHRILSRFRTQVQPALGTAERTAAETLWQQGRICIQEFFQQQQLRQSVSLLNQNRVLNKFAVSLSAATDFQALLDVIARDLPGMGIPSCYLSLYTDPACLEGEARLVLAFCDGQRVLLPPDGVLFAARQLVPEDLLPAGRGYAMVVEPLFYQERQLGLIVQEYTGADENLFVFLQKQISSALDRLMIGQEVRDSERRYYTLVENLREMILVHRAGKLLVANRAAREYMESWGQGKTLLDFILEESQPVAKKDSFSTTESGDQEIDILDGAGLERRMIVRKQEVVFGHAPAEQVILIDITERKHLEDHLYFMSTHDVLTGLYNRAFFEREMTRSYSESECPVSIIVVDVNDLKVVNDYQGHSAGDQLLRLVASVMLKSFRREDIISRIGGDEFAVILPQMDERGMQASIERIRRQLNDINQQQTEYFLSLSIGGVTARAGESLSLYEAYKQADQAMYCEKALQKGSR